MISRYCIATVVLLVTFDACAEGRSRDEPAAGADGAGIDKPLAERITALKQEFEARVKAVSSELAAARKAGAKGGSKEIKAVIGNFQRDWEKTAKKVVSLVRAHPTDPAAFEGILLLRGGFDDDILEIVREHFLNDPRMGRLSISTGPSTPSCGSWNPPQSATPTGRRDRPVPSRTFFRRS